MHVVDLEFDFDSQQTLECLLEVEIQYITPLMTPTNLCLELLNLALVLRALPVWHLT